jgi:predicted site-specific integrase-resolvase
MKRKITKRLVADRHSVCTKTVERWVETGILPKPEIINGRWYFDEASLEQRERDRLVAAQQSTTETTA